MPGDIQPSSVRVSVKDFNLPGPRKVTSQFPRAPAHDRLHLDISLQARRRPFLARPPRRAQIASWILALATGFPRTRARFLGEKKFLACCSEAQRVPCPFCAELILPAAKLCRFCGHELAPEWGRPAAPARGGGPAPITSWKMPPPPELRQ